MQLIFKRRLARRIPARSARAAVHPGPPARRACSLAPEGSARGPRAFDRLDAPVAQFLEDVTLAA